MDDNELLDPEADLAETDQLPTDREEAESDDPVVHGRPQTGQRGYGPGGAS